MPDDNVLRAARDLLTHSNFSEIEDYAGRMLALQDLVGHEEFDKLALVERESDSPFFLEIVKAVRREALAGDLDYAHSVAGEFLEEAFRIDTPTVTAWDQYQNRIRSRRIDSGLGLIDPPDDRDAEPEDAGREDDTKDEAGVSGNASGGTVDIEGKPDGSGITSARVCLTFDLRDGDILQVSLTSAAKRVRQVG